jgi:hypothetical protein
VRVGEVVNTQGVTRSKAFGDVPVQYSLTDVSDWPDQRVADTIAVMCQYACEDASDPLVVEDAQSAMALGGGDPLLGVWKLCKERFDFRQDEELSEGTDLPPVVKANIVEVLIRPRDVAQMWRMGMKPLEDCDGYSTYAASLLLALGVIPRFCTVAVDPRDPSEYSHVYLVAYTFDGGRVALDASHGKYAGWECPNPFGKRREWVVEHVPWGAFVLGALALAVVAWFVKA